METKSRKFRKSRLKSFSCFGYNKSRAIEAQSWQSAKRKFEKIMGVNCLKIEWYVKDDIHILNHRSRQF